MPRTGRLPLLLVALCFPFALYYSTWMVWNERDERRTTQSVGLIQNVITDDSDPCLGNEKLLEIVAASGFVLEASNRELICRTMPSWSEISRLYGDEPVILGLEKCAAYREQVRKANAYPMPRVAGLQNCGTTAFADTLFYNLKRDPTIHVEHPRAYNVPWRKHTPLRYRLNVTSDTYDWQEDKDLVLPIVIVREPYRWMQSMCKMPYRVHWDHSSRHCPNLVAYPSGDENETLEAIDVSFGEVPPGEEVYYPSLAHLWSEWNRDYLEADIPRLIIRYEDTLFHAEEVFKSIAECVGMEQAHPTFQRMVESAKSEREKSIDLLTALQKNGRFKDRFASMIVEDMMYAKENLDAQLMDLFHYHQPDGVPSDSFAAEEWLERQSKALKSDSSDSSKLRLKN